METLDPVFETNVKKRMMQFRAGLDMPRMVALLFLATGLTLLSACRNSARAREHVEKGNEYLAQQQLSSAEKEDQQAIEINPNSADAYYRLGLLQIQQEYPTVAVQSFSRAVDLDPKNLDARLHLG